MSIRISFDNPTICRKCGNMEYAPLSSDGFYEKQFGHGYNRMAKLCNIYYCLWCQSGKAPYLLARDIEPCLRQGLFLLSGLEKECKMLENTDCGITYYNFTEIVSSLLGHCMLHPYSKISVCK